MNIPCKHCCQSGNYIAYTGYQQSQTSAVSPNLPYMIVSCKSCKGTGWIDEEELITVPRKFVKDEYFKNF